jgi:hypothetical protein
MFVISLSFVFKHFKKKHMYLFQIRQYSVGFDVICVSSNFPDSPNNFKRTSSGDYRHGYCLLLQNNICGGVYHIRPSTYSPNQEGPFILEIASTHEFQLNRI